MRFFLNVVPHIHPCERMTFKLSKLEYQASITTAAGVIPRDLASFDISQRWSMRYIVHKLVRRPPSAKLFKGHGSWVYEIVNLDDCLYVLYAFQKKSKSSIKTPKTDLTIIETRLKLLKSHLKKR